MSWFQTGEGHDDPSVDTALLRLNMQTQNWRLTNQMHPTFQKLNGYSWVVDTTKGSRLAAVIGWAEDNNVMPRDVTWGWGVGIIIKDEVHDTLKTLVKHQSVKAAFTANDFSDHTLLRREAYDVAVMGIVAYYLDRPMGVDASVFRAAASPRSVGPGDAVELALRGEIDTLRAQLEKLEAPRQDSDNRVAWNKDDGDPVYTIDPTTSGIPVSNREPSVPGTTAVQRGLDSGRLREVVKPSPQTGEWAHPESERIEVVAAQIAGSI